MSRLKQLIQEVHRRSLWQVLLVYVGASWVVLEAADVMVSRLALPEWVYGAAIVLLLVGLPIVLATAFVQEGLSAAPRHDPTLIPGGKLDADAGPREVGGARRLLTWRNAGLSLKRFCAASPTVRIYRTDRNDDQQGLTGTNDTDGDHILIRTNGDSLEVKVRVSGEPLESEPCL